MQATTLSFANIHNHGALFANAIRARRETASAVNKWDLPNLSSAEYDQYDTPQSRWVAVHDDTGEVLAGVRMTPTTAQCGVYSYMIKDAQNGLLGSIPENLLYEDAPCDEVIWEVTRGFVAKSIPEAIRRKVHLRLVAQMLQTCREEGIGRMLALIPANWTRWSGRCQLEMKAAGPRINMGGMDYQAVWIDFSKQLN